MLARFALAFVVMAATFVGATDAFADRRVALVIGNSNYVKAGVLPNPVNDAEDIAKALSALGFEVISEKNLDKRGMDDAFRRFARSVGGADVAVFYYAGHAMEFNGTNYLMPVDAKLADEADLKYEMAKVDDVLDEMRRAKGVRIVVLDGCRDNPLETQLKQRSIQRLGRSGAASRGLAPIEGSAEGMLIAYATAARTTADDGTGRNSPFTAAFLKHVATPGLEVSGLFKRVRAEVFSATGNRQRPEIVDSLIGDYAFVPGGTERRQPDQMDVFAWGLLKDTTDVSALRRFVDQFPTSQHRREAEQRIASLQVTPGPTPPALPPVSRDSTVPPAAPQGLLPPGPVPPLPPGPPVGGDVVAICDRLAGAPFEPDRAPGAPGVDIDRIEAGQATQACRDAVGRSPGVKRLEFNLARALVRSGDFTGARGMLLPLASGGHAGAMNLIGSMFENGQGLPKDATQARQWFDRGARAGSVLAMGNIARFHQLGLGGLPRDLNQARTWYEIAANAGLPVAAEELGDMYDEGNGVPKDENRARVFYERAAAGGMPRSAVNLGFYHETGKGGLRPDVQQARIWYERGALGGNAVGMTNLAWLLESGAVGAKDFPQAKVWYIRAVEKGNPRAMNNLGVMLERGLGGPVDLAGARSMYERAAGLNYNFAMSNLGDLYDAGRGVPKNEAEALRWYEKAANLGHASAQNSLGIYFELGKGGLTPDPVTARQWYEKSAALGNANAMNNLGLLYENGKGVPQSDATAREWYQKGAARGSASAMNNYGIMLELGRGGPKDISEAFRQYTAAAELGNSNGMYNLGLMYANGVGVAADPSQARLWYEKAANAGSNGAMNNLAILLENGQGGPVDFVRARQLYERSASLGNYRAMFNVGLMFENGKGMAKNDFEARAWYERAVQGQHAGAMDSLGVLLMQGRGGAPNQARAAQLFLTAARLGDRDARRRLLETHASLTPDVRVAVQRQLAAEGFQPGPANGQFGQQTLRAIESYTARR